MAEEKPFPAIECTEAEDWKPYEGGGYDLVSVDGLARQKITKAELVWVEKSGNAAIKLSFALDDPNHAPIDQGKRGSKVIPYTGTNAKGANVSMLYDAMFSAGKAAAEITALKGKKLQPENAVKWFVGRHFYTKMTAQESTKNRGVYFTEHSVATPQYYEDMRSSGGLARAHGLVNGAKSSGSSTGTKSNGATTESAPDETADIQL